MKAAISATGPDLASGIDPRFGRCAYLIFYDTDTGEWEALPNSNREAAGGAGIRTAQAVIDRGAAAVVTGNIGPNAMQVLSGQVKVHTGFSGTVEEAVRALEEGRLSETAAPTVEDHAGMAGRAGGPPSGPGAGSREGPAGGGPAGGMGMGRGAGGGLGPAGTPGPAGGPTGTWRRGGRGRGGGGRGAGRW